jgi:Alpha/beta hydrolase family
MELYQSRTNGNTDMDSHSQTHIERPTWTLLASEPWRAAKEFVTYVASPIRASATGDGHPVVLFPGLGSSGRSLTALRKHCDSLGYRAMDWGRGFNTGPQGNIDDWLHELADHTIGLMKGCDGRATLIGWSLGGLYARELAKLLPSHVRQVISIGSPFNSPANHTHAGWLFRLLSGANEIADPMLMARLRTPPPVPTTSIYSRTDGIVAWQACRHDRVSRRVQDIEIVGSHIGMGWNPAVLRVIADRLGQSRNKWRSYRASETRAQAA